MNLVAIEISPAVFPVSLLYHKSDGSNYRRCVSPDDTISSLPQTVQDKIQEHWRNLGGKVEYDKINNPPVPPLSEIDIENIARSELREEFLKTEEDKNLTERISLVRAKYAESL
jgi:hypothetical protein